MISTNTFKTQPSEKPGPNDVVFSVNMKDKVVESTEVKWSHFNGWTEYPIYKKLNAVDSNQLKPYNKEGVIYVYNPQHTFSDEMGVLEYKLLGATKKKSDKRVLLIVEDLHPNATFKQVYFEVRNDKVVYCGQVIPETLINFNSVNEGLEYAGFRRSKWVKLSVNDFQSLTGKVYEDAKSLD